jgi:vacuolar-type H+-ATPase subunit H
MKLIEDIKKAEEKGENLKKNAEIEGQQLIEKARSKGDKEIAALDSDKEKLLEKDMAKAQKKIAAEINKMDAQHAETLKKINTLYEKNEKKAIDKIQDLILKWPSSQ